MSFLKMDIGKMGYCLLPGHPVQHRLESDCWTALRHFVYDTDNYAAYVKKCKEKNKRD